MIEPMLRIVKAIAQPQLAVAAAAAAAAATASGCGQVDQIVSDPAGQATNATRIARDAGRSAERVATNALEKATPVAKAARQVAVDAARPGGYPIQLPGGRRVRVDLRKCIRKAGEGRYPATGAVARPRTATQACAAAARMLLAQASPVPPKEAISALARTADAGGLDVQGALNELDKETR